MPENRLTLIDERTGKRYEVPIHDGNIRAADLRKIKVDPDEFGMMSYDPAFLNTASCKSAITYIDGDRGMLWYRGYPIEELAETCSFLEVAYLLLNGELPTREELDAWEVKIKRHTMIHETSKKFLEGFRYDAHPMGMMISTVAALSTVYPDARTSTIRTTAKSRSPGSSPRCPPSAPTATATPSACPTSIPITT